MNHNRTALAEKVEPKFKKELDQNLVVVYGRKGCFKTQELASKLVFAVKERILIVSIDENGNDEEMGYLELFEKLFDTKDLPLVFIKKKYIGGTAQVMPMLDSDLKTLTSVLRDTLVYEVCVVGGGTCGLRAAIEASKDSLVALVDFDVSTMKENKTGLGNASKLISELLPKYFMHKKVFSLKRFEKIDTRTIWQDSINVIQKKMRALAQENLKQIQDNPRIRYFEGRVEILDSHSVKVNESSGFSHILTAKKLIIATGTKLPKDKIEGSDLGITAEQLFRMQRTPGKTLIVGDTLKCLELGGILGKLGVQCYVITTGTCKSFDKSCLDEVIHTEKIIGVRFLLDYKVTRLSKNGENIIVHGLTNSGQEYIENFDTVCFANNRRGRTSNLGVDNVGLRVNRRNSKIMAKPDGLTDNPSVFVTGSVLDGPQYCSDNATYVQHAINLVRGFRNNFTSKLNMNMVPRVALTPKEYGSVGDTEETAVALFGKDEISVYQANIGQRFIKIVCVKERQDRIIGIHVLSSQVADLLQSFVTCMIKGITKSEVNMLQFSEKQKEEKPKQKK